MARVIWKQSARDDLRDIVNFIAKDSPAYARKLATRLVEAPPHLKHSPRMGRVVPELKQDDIRELVTVRSYRLIYVLRDDTCYVVAIIHSSRDLPGVLGPEDLESN